MQTELSNEPLIDPEVKAYIFSLVSALGGSSAEHDGRYVLGDDALAVLKDIKRWLRLYDDKLNRLDVSRLLADGALVQNDLLEMLASWPEDAPEGSFRSKIALLCVDLLTQLTWPIEQDAETATMARYLHVPTLRKAQASYKAALLNHPSTRMLHTVARICLPALAQRRDERSPYEDTIIKVVLYFFRNVAMISQPGDVPIDEAESGIDRSTTIDEFHYQDIFSLILAICSNMHEDYSTHDVELLDIIFHLVKGVDTDNLFMEDQELVSGNTIGLRELMGLEKGMHATAKRHAPSRHNRFGTMVWVGRDGEKRSTLFGQRAAAGEQLTMSEMDKSKKWKRPRRPIKKDAQQQPEGTFDAGVRLTARARRHLRSFVEQFLDSSFNPLFLAVRRAIERENPRVLPQQHMQQYLYLISWFLRAECARRKKQSAGRANRARATQTDIESFALVATVLNQETFVLLNRFMQTALDDKKWQDLNAGMKCFTQILLTVQEMSESPLDEDQEIAENILNRIFYEQTTHDRIIALLRSYKDQEFGYLDACTELSHVFLRLLERYSKQNVDMQVRSRRRARKKKRAVQPTEEPNAANEDRDKEVEDVADAQRAVTERKFDFHRFSARFINQTSVDTFVALLRHYHDLNNDQLKRCHRFFYRIAFKMELIVFLFRMDIIQLLNKLVKGPEGLNVETPSFKEWEELIRQVFRRLVKRMEERPALAVELLFSKIPSTMFYLEHGYEKELPKKVLRAAAELEIKPGLERKEQIGVAVSILINQSKLDALAWVKGLLFSAASERKSWEDANAALTTLTGPATETTESRDELEQGQSPQPSVGGMLDKEQAEISKAPLIIVKADSPERTKATHQDKHLRLLLTVLAFEKLTFDAEATETTWIIPSAIHSLQLSRDAELIANFEFDLPIFEDGKSAEDMTRRKQAPRPAQRPRTDHDTDDTEGSTGTDIEEGLFPAGGPIIAPNENRKKSRLLKRQKRSADDTLDPEILEARRRAKRKSEAEKNAKIKSGLYIHESDDEDDEERDRLFFEKERAMRQKVAAAGGNLGYMSKQHKYPNSKKAKRKAPIVEGVDGSHDSDSTEPTQKKRKTPKRAILVSDDECEVDGSQHVAPFTRKARRPATTPQTSASNSGLEENASSAETDTETPPSSQRPLTGFSSVHSSQARKVGIDAGSGLDGADSGSDKENAPKSMPAPARRSVRAGFIIDSDSDG